MSGGRGSGRARRRGGRGSSSGRGMLRRLRGRWKGRELMARVSIFFYVVVLIPSSRGRRRRGSRCRPVRVRPARPDPLNPPRRILHAPLLFEMEGPQGTRPRPSPLPPSSPAPRERQLRRAHARTGGTYDGRECRVRATGGGVLGAAGKGAEGRVRQVPRGGRCACAGADEGEEGERAGCSRRRAGRVLPFRESFLRFMREIELTTHAGYDRRDCGGHCHLRKGQEPFRQSRNDQVARPLPQSRHLSPSQSRARVPSRSPHQGARGFRRARSRRCGRRVGDADEGRRRARAWGSD